jgi:integrase
MRALVDWCVARGLPWRELAAQDFCAFLRDQDALGLRHVTLQRRVYSVRRVFSLAGLPDPTRDPEVSLTLRKISRLRSNRPRQARGISAQMLDEFLDAQPDSPWGLRNRALLSVGYDLLARRSEITALRSEDVAWRRDGTLEVIVRRSKSDQAGMGRVAFTSRRSARLLSEWLDWRGPDLTPLFCGIYRRVALDRPLSGATVRNIIRSAARGAGYDKFVVEEFSGHSLRVGAAQELLRRGHDGAAIMRAGGWKTTAVMARYLASAQHNVWQSG